MKGTRLSSLLLSPRLKHFNLDAKSEGLPAPKSDEPPQMGEPGGRGRTSPTYYEPTKHTPGAEKSRRSAGDALMERTHREDRLVVRRGSKHIANKTEAHRICEIDKSLTNREDKEILITSDGAGAVLASIPQEGTIHCKWEQRKRHVHSHQHTDARVGR